MSAPRPEPAARGVCIGVVLFALCVCPATAAAEITWVELKIVIALEKWDSWLGNSTKKAERRAIAIVRRAYNQKQGNTTVGHAMIDGEALSDLPEGNSATLTFAFIDAPTGEPVEVPELASVRYEIQTNPPTEVPVFEILGTSSDAASGFAFPYIISGFEPLVIAIPLNGLGEPIEMLSPGGSDVSGGVAINIFVERIPTVSEWGLIVLTLLLLTAGTVLLGRRRPATA